MGLPINENFVDRVFISATPTGVGVAALSPTCTIIDESDNRTAGTVADMGNGWYKVTDFTPDAIGTWCTEWRVGGTYIIHYPYKEFYVSHYAWKYQTPATKTQANPAQDTWYDILAETTGGVKIYTMGMSVAVANENCRMQVIIDGETITGQGTTLTAGQKNWAHWQLDSVNLTGQIDIQPNSTGGTTFMVGFLEGHTVQVQMQKYTSNGAGDLTGIVCYAKWEPIT
jgi:hypothetical protein